MIYELREYLAADGRSEALHRRFADHTLGLFERHGLEVAGFWADTADDGKLVYLLRFPDEETRRAAWSAFQSDVDWQRVKADSEADGPIVTEMRSTLLTNPPYWPYDTTAAAI
jgi:hypothetical protein